MFSHRSIPILRCFFCLTTLYFTLVGCGGSTPERDVTPTPFPTASPVPTASPSPSQNTSYKILFQSDRSGTNEIYSMNPDGTEQTKITNLNLNAGKSYSCVWSPDRKKIAFYFYRYQDSDNGYTELYTMNPDGTGQIKLANDALSFGESKPAWSPDSKKIAFTSSLDGGIDVINSDGTNRKQLVSPENNANYNSSWSHDGKKIAFVSINQNNNANFEIYSINLDGTEKKNLTNTPKSDFDPFWSSDDKKITYWADNSIFTMNADGTEQKNLTTKISLFPKWSPDGKKILFSADGIYTINPDGTEEKRLANSSSPFYHWSPDGKQIVFLNSPEGNEEIYVMNADGSEQKRLTNNTASDFFPVW
jgi:Tol biopolymer transport system component